MALKLVSVSRFPCTVFSRIHKLLFVLICVSVLWCAVNMATLPSKKHTPKPFLESLGVPASGKRQTADVDNIVTFSRGLAESDGITRRNQKRHLLTSNSSDVMNSTDFVTDEPVSDVRDSNLTTSRSSVWYNTASWLPIKGMKPLRSANLAFLPMLALIFFLFGVCIKCYSWVRDQDRTKARGQLDFEDDELNYSIITAGEQGYKEVEFRSDTTSMYDTVNSFRNFSFPGHQNTVTSVKSLPAHPSDFHHSILIHQDVGVYDTVQSYKAFLERSIQIKDFEIDVELVSDYKPRKRSKSYGDFAPSANATNPPKNRKRRMRRHSGGRGMEGTVKSQTERERRRRHSEKSPGQAANPEFLKSKTFHRRSSPAILDPLVSDSNVPPHEGEEDDASHCPTFHLPIDRQFSNSSSSSHSSGGSRRQKESSQKPRRERLRRNRSSQDTTTAGTRSFNQAISDRLVKGSSHSSGHCSDDSPQSSASDHGHSSNEIDSESDVTDSGLVAEAGKSTPHSCFRHPHPLQDPDLKGQPKVKRIQRFKVSFVDEEALAAASDSDSKKVKSGEQK